MDNKKYFSNINGKYYVDDIEKIPKATNYKMNKSNDLVVNDVLECILSYLYNNDKLYYGNNTALNDTMGVQDGKKAIDCSTLMCLALNGVPYEKSRYNLGGDKYNNNPDYFYAVNVYDNGTSNFRRYANMMGEYFYNMGLTYKPTKDFKNLRTGDLMFWQGEHTDGSFLDITHVAMFLELTVDNKVKYIDANVRTPVVSIASTDISDDFFNTIVLCARPSYNNLDYTLAQNIVNGNSEHIIQTTGGVNYYTLSPLQKGYYTILIKGSGDSPSVKSNNVSIASKYIGNGLYIAHLRLEDVSKNIINVYVSNNEKLFNLKWCCVYRRFIETPYPFYIAPTIRGNRGKVRLDNDKTVPQSSSAYVLINMESIVGSNYNGIYHLSNDGCISIEETGQYLVNIGVANKSTTFANFRAVMFEQGGSSPTVLCQDNIIGESGHSTYKRMTFGYTFTAGQRIGLQLNNTGDMTLLKGSFGTYIEVIKL